MTRVAVLGTGRMGGAIGRRLAASGFDLIVWDRTPAKAQGLNVGPVARTPAEAIHDADIAISSLTNAAAVRDVYLGPQGAFGTSDRPLFVEMSTAGPESIEQLSREARTRGLRLLEAPVIGSAPPSRAGPLPCSSLAPHKISRRRAPSWSSSAKSTTSEVSGARPG